MLATFKAYYVPVLYSIVGIFLAMNVLGLLSGSWISLLPIAIQASVIVSVYMRKPWAYVIVRVWAAICIIAGGAIWLAVLLRGGEIVQPAARVVCQTLLLLVGVPLYKYAKVVLSQRVRMDEALQPIQRQDI